MSRQIQIRRGTAAEHTTFTGAIGEITMDTTNNTLRVHDGTTAGGTPLAKQSEIPAPYTMPENYDFVVEYQAPTSNNDYTWYRKYQSGWVEQGGYKAGTGTWGTASVTFPVEMANVYYALSVIGNTPISDFTNSNNAVLRGTTRSAATNKSTTGFTYQANNDMSWFVCGIAG